MINLNFLREEPAAFKQNILKKDPTFPVDKLIELDGKLRAKIIEVEQIRFERNERSKNIRGPLSDADKVQALKFSENLKLQELQLDKLKTEFNELYLTCPNIISADLPNGGKEANKVVKVVGQKPVFDFKIKNHLELNKINNWFDMEAAAQMTGSQFVFYKSPAVNLIYALTRIMLKNNKSCGYEPVLPPYLVNEKSLENASNFPKFKDQVYKITDEDLYLTPTAEVNLTNYYRDHIFNSSDLPIRMTAWTSCFRREAGSYGAQERGLIRIHQFEKVELYTICKPHDAESEQLKMLQAAENILTKLGLHYRISLLATQDCSFAAYKTFDLEVWMPGQNAYYEVSSCSNCTDFQARRTGLRFKDDKKNQLVNTLNCSSLALPRLIVALMETYQQADGSIKLPDSVLEEALW
jgi:seryl-tRNA synthetase